MRPRMTLRIDAAQVQSHARRWVQEGLGFKEHGRIYTANCVVSILLIAAARMCSIYAACRDLAKAPSDQAVRDALFATLPAIDPLQKRINQTLTCELPRRVFRHKRIVAMDVTLIPYYGEPQRHPNELYHSKQKAGTTKFHGYATACIVHHGMRYTVALTRIEKGEKLTTIVTRLVRQVRAAGLKIKLLLLDRGFFTVDVITYLKRARVPFLMPVANRGVCAKDPARRNAGLRGFRRKPTGWYDYTFQGKNKQKVRICVCAKYYHHQKSGQRRLKRYLFAAWGYQAPPVVARERYRKRFGIETSYRQLHESRIRTCSRSPLLRLLFFAVGLILRNVWAWLHFMYFAARRGEHPTLRLGLLRLRQMLNWIERTLIDALHDGSLPSTQWQNE